jgi:uncharacterized protein (DUF885 family)
MILRILVGVIFTGIVGPLALANPAFDPWAEAFAQDWVRLDPLNSTSTQYLPAAEQSALDRKLIAQEAEHSTPYSPAIRAEREALARRGLEQLKRWSPSELTPTQRTSAEFLGWTLRDTLETSRVGGTPYVFDQFYGMQVTLVTTFNELHPLRNARDVDNYLARLSVASATLDEGIAEARRRADRGMIPPRFIIDSAVAAMDRFTAFVPADNLLITEFTTRLKDVPGLAAADQAKAVVAATKIVAEQILPAYARVKALLLEQRQVASDDAGLSARPGGTELYAALLASETTTTMTPEQVHRLGLREVARIESEMDKELVALGYKTGSLRERVAKLQADTQPPAQPDPRPAMMQETLRIVRDAELRAQPLFPVRPKAPIEVKRVTAFTEATTAAHYTPPAPDGSRPGVYWVPLPGPEYDLLDFRTTAYHEAVPGHHFQIALQQELPDLPRFRQRGVFNSPTAFVEGWALYAERIADESGWYQGDPRGRLGYLASMLFRARRLVVDTGLHTMKWTRQQAIDYGFTATEIERYCVLPGQACAYMIGQLKIVELREHARAALGEKFSLPAYHTLLLKTGPVPLDVLATVVDEWISAEKSPTPNIPTPKKPD